MGLVNGVLNIYFMEEKNFDRNNCGLKIGTISHESENQLESPGNLCCSLKLAGFPKFSKQVSCSLCACHMVCPHQISTTLIMLLFLSPITGSFQNWYFVSIFVISVEGKKETGSSLYPWFCIHRFNQLQTEIADVSTVKFWFCGARKVEIVQFL